LSERVPEVRFEDSNSFQGTILIMPPRGLLAALNNQQIGRKRIVASEDGVLTLHAHDLADNG